MNGIIIVTKQPTIEKLWSAVYICWGYDIMNYKKYAAIILSALCLTACGNNTAASDETAAGISETTVEASETTTAETAEETEITETEPEETFEETTDDYDTGNPEEGLVYFVQPSISQDSEKSSVDSWECRDGEVLRDFHYDGEWDYRKELIFAFSNYTDEPMTVDSIQIVRDSDGVPMTFTNGSDTLEIDFTVEPLHKTDYLLKSADFDYSACESGIYRTVVSFGGEKSEFNFFIDNCGLYRSKHTSENWGSYDDNGSYISYEYDVFAPTFLSEEQQQIFAEAQGIMWDWFWCESYLPQDYIDKHTPDDFKQMLYGVFTKKYADELSKKYIDKNGEFIPMDGARGGDIFYFDHCFFPVSADDSTVEFKAVVTYAHSDWPYVVSFDDDFHYVMKNTGDGWRVDRFDLWN